MKKVWISVLGEDQQMAQELMATVKNYGLEPDGHFWNSEIEKSGWMGPRQNMLDPDMALWIIAGGKSALQDKDIAYGMSLLGLCIQAERGAGFPIYFLYDPADPVSTDDLPTPLKHADVLALDSSAAGAKLVARANKPFKPGGGDCRLDSYGLANLGTWLEVGPASGAWKGVMLGVSGEGADIEAHGVGPKGKLPQDKMILNYPQKGLKIELGDKEFTAWAVRNELDDNNSYFVKVTGTPESLLFGEFANGDEAEVYVVDLC